MPKRRFVKEQPCEVYFNGEWRRGTYHRANPGRLGEYVVSVNVGGHEMLGPLAVLKKHVDEGLTFTPREGNKLWGWYLGAWRYGTYLRRGDVAGVHWMTLDDYPHHGECRIINHELRIAE